MGDGLRVTRSATMRIVSRGAHIALVRPDRHWFQMVAAWINDPRVNQTLVTAIPWPLEAPDASSWLPTGEPLMAFLIAPVSANQTGGRGLVDHPVGLCHFHSYDHETRSIKIAILIEPASQGRGYGTEAVRLLVDYAFETFDLNRICLSAFGNNPAGLRAYERAGFRLEGVRRRVWYRAGAWHDDVMMSVLRHEWEHARRTM
jgi:RimJ/RimL family protein N-acetyltransferase